MMRAGDFLDLGGCEMPDDDQYTFAETELLSESQRVHFVEGAFDPMTIQCLESIGVARGWRCVEVGAGAGSITRWLAQQVGSEGEVVAIDYNPRFLTGLPNNVRVRKVDVLEEGAFEECDFDLVHCRLFLMYMPDKVEILRRMAATLRPGGVVFAEEPDFNLATYFGWPEAREQLAVSHRLRAAQEASGQGSPFRDFPELLLEAGLEPIGIKYSASQVYGPADPMFQF
jgi:SAM-dependent methyltransferase